MTVSNPSFAWDHTSDAQFRVWASGVSTALAAVGLVQTADTGQINLATALRPTNGVSAGYQIWRFNDALQATAPVFIKMEYGTSDNSSAIPQMWFTIGVATDGAGTLTGTRVTPRRNISAFTTSSSGGAKASYFAYSGTALTAYFAMDFTATQCVGALCIERTLNADGTANGEAVFGVSYSLGSAGHVVLPFDTTLVPSAAHGAPCLIPFSAVTTNPFVTGIKGADVSFFPYSMSNNKVQGAPRGVFGYFGSDVPKGTIVPLTVYGVLTNYLACGTPVASMAISPGALTFNPNIPSGASMLLRYE